MCHEMAGTEICMPCSKGWLVQCPPLLPQQCKNTGMRTKNQTATWKSETLATTPLPHTILV